MYHTHMAVPTEQVLGEKPGNMTNARNFVFPLHPKIDWELQSCSTRTHTRPEDIIPEKYLLFYSLIPIFYPLFFQISHYSQYFYLLFFPNLMQQKTDYAKRFHAILQEVQTWHSWLADFTLTGMTLQGSKAVEAVDDQEVMRMCWLQYVLPQFWAQLVLVPPMYPPPFFSNRTHTVVTDFPYILPIILELFFRLFAFYYSQIILGIISSGLIHTYRQFSR